MASAEQEEFVRTISTVEVMKRAFLDNLSDHQGKDLTFATQNDCYLALAYTVRERLIQRWLDTLHVHTEAKAKTVYYFSAEYLLGRQLNNSLLNAELMDVARQALLELGMSLDALAELETEPGLGNGGLGRLAACFLDSLATLSVPAVGYGIRYEYGIFRQTFENGWQVEQPDAWLARGNPWEFPVPDEAVEVQFGGYTERYADENGRVNVRWRGDRTVVGVPYNIMVPGYRSGTVNTIRLWRSRATQSFDLHVFNTGDYTRAVAQKVASENISTVLYPDDSTPQGRQLRLEQQYFFVACSLADILRQLPPMDAADPTWDRLPERIVIQLNDTHPTIGIPEMMRLLVDERGLEWDRAWEITRQCFAYTNHTLLPEALETWPVGLMQSLLPRHWEIIIEINRRLLAEVRARFPGDEGRVARMSVIDESGERRVRMGFLAAMGSFSINGVAELQSRLLAESVLRDFAELWPEKFNNKTNGITPRRFMRLANPRLSALISSKIGEGWVQNLDELRGLEASVDDAGFRDAWRRVKQQNKGELAALIGTQTGLTVDPNAMFDVMVKRLHEYKRQLLNALHIITLYHRAQDEPNIEILPRVVVFGAKAAPGYRLAKLIIKLINSVGDVVNNDPLMRDRLKVVFLPNYNVTLAERIYPAADLSEQISLAGKEASGTGNMKLALNGALTIGTLDGANIEIRNLVGEENFFLFGLTTDEVAAAKAAGYHPRDYYDRDPQLKRAIDAIAVGAFSQGDRDIFRPIVDSLLGEDPYMLCADYHAYIDCQDTAARAYRDPEAWTRMSILNTARCGFFSSDRAMRQYLDDIWHAHPVPVKG